MPSLKTKCGHKTSHKGSQPHHYNHIYSKCSQNVVTFTTLYTCSGHAHVVIQPFIPYFLPITTCIGHCDFMVVTKVVKCSHQGSHCCHIDKQ